MNVTEANDVFTILRWLGAHPLDGQMIGAAVGDDRAAAAFDRLTQRAGGALHMPVRSVEVADAFDRLQRRVDDTASAAAAHAVCEVLAHQARFGTALVQWSTFAAEFRRWHDLQPETQ